MTGRLRGEAGEPGLAERPAEPEDVGGASAAAVEEDRRRRGLLDRWTFPQYGDPRVGIAAYWILSQWSTNSPSRVAVSPSAVTITPGSFRSGSLIEMEFSSSITGADPLVGARS